MLTLIQYQRFNYFLMGTGQNMKVELWSYSTTAEEIPDIKRDKLLLLIIIIIISELLKAYAKKEEEKPLFI